MDFSDVVQIKNEIDVVLPLQLCREQNKLLIRGSMDFSILCVTCRVYYSEIIAIRNNLFLMLTLGASGIVSHATQLHHI